MRCKNKYESFVPGKSLLGIVIDWCNAACGLGLDKAVGKEAVIKLLKGCRVHWTRSWQRIRDCVCTSTDRAREMKLLLQIFKSCQVEAQFEMHSKFCANIVVVATEYPGLHG